MKEVCVITGGGSGMGLATAKYIKDRLVIISGRTESKLAAACEDPAPALLSSRSLPLSRAPSSRSSTAPACPRP